MASAINVNELGHDLETGVMEIQPFFFQVLDLYKGARWLNG